MKGWMIWINIFLFSYAQEGIRPLTNNPFLNREVLVPEKKNSSRSRSSLTLPFFDDFSYFHQSSYPDPTRWSDSLVYVNDGMGIAPLSQGVATFDGLNKKGFPYTPNLNFPAGSSAYADTLTSVPINLFTLTSQTLTPADSIALIFYYQRGGWGDNPEIQDSLMLDFYKPKQMKWQKRVWHVKGHSNPNITDTVFRRVFIFITDTAYFHEGFRFRFRNKAQTNGNFDIWNLDYVYLDKNRSMVADTSWNDLCFGRRPSPFLKRYSTMPWKHYHTGEMANKYSNYIRFNGTTTVNTTYQMEVRDQNHSLIYNISYGASNLHPFWSGGWQSNTVHSVPSLSFAFPAMSDSSDFIIKHYMNNLSGDTRIENDTLIIRQFFRNYFAYDDGTCENGYYVLGTGGKAVYFYHLKVQDTLRAVRILFDPAGNINLSQSYTFRIQVYTASGGVPGNRIYQDSLKNVQYVKGGYGIFAEYELTHPVVLPAGDYFIGYQQFVAAGITVGLDRNYYFPGKLFYDSGMGWTASSVKGSLMMRPVFGKKNTLIGLNDFSISSESPVIFPNPTEGMIQIYASGVREGELKLFSVDGSCVFNKKVKTRTQIPLENLSPGIYFYILTFSDTVQRGKLIINR